MTLAADLLRDIEVTFAAIACTVGTRYDDVFGFTVAFKRS